MAIDSKFLTSILFALIGAPSVLNSIANTNPAFAAAVARRAYQERPNLIPDLQTLVRAVQSQNMNIADGQRLAKQSGYADWIWKAVYDSARQYLSPLDYITLEFRGTLQGEGVDSVLARLGFNTDDITNLRNVSKYLPTPDDMIRFAVRDIYDPDARASQGLDDGFPADFASNAAKLGMDDETAHNFWASHWQLPSPTQVFDMLHRGLIGSGDVQDYLRAADYIPIWRQRLEQISYDVITRIDAKNLRIHGIIGDDELATLYQHMGYSPDDAQLLVKLTLSEINHTEVTTPKGNILADYKAGTITRDQAQGLLTAQGYSSSDASLALDTADAQIKQELIDLESDAIIDQYVRGQIDVNEVRTQLTKLGVSQRLMDITIAREVAQARKRTKSPTKSDLDKWYIWGMITDDTYKKKLANLGYLDADIKMYLIEEQLAVIQGADAKLPWAYILRDVVSGGTDPATAIEEITAAGYDDATMVIWNDIINGLAPQ